MSETLSTLEYGDVSPPSQSAEVFYSITSHFTKQAKKRQQKNDGQVAADARSISKTMFPLKAWER